MSIMNKIILTSVETVLGIFTQLDSFKNVSTFSDYPFYQYFLIIIFLIITRSYDMTKM